MVINIAWGKYYIECFIIKKMNMVKKIFKYIYGREMTMSEELEYLYLNNEFFLLILISIIVFIITYICRFFNNVL